MSLNRRVTAVFPFLAFLGRQTIAVVLEMGKIGIFTGRACAAIFWPPLKAAPVLQQIHFIGMKSLLIIALTGLFTGMVLGLQLYYALSKFGSEAMLGSAVALALIRELGPVTTALMVTGRAGSSMAAELGIMRISEQIDALDTMDIEPVRFLVSPKILASIISFPLLTAIFDVVGIIGGYLTGVILLGVNPGVFLHRMEDSVDMKDICEGFIKSLVFALLVCAISCYQGYTTHERKEGFGARGVSRSTTTAVVMSSVIVLIADYVLTSFLL